MTVTRSTVAVMPETRIVEGCGSAGAKSWMLISPWFAKRVPAATTVVYCVTTFAPGTPDSHVTLVRTPNCRATPEIEMATGVPPSRVPMSQTTKLASFVQEPWLAPADTNSIPVGRWLLNTTPVDCPGPGW